jgi:hypothetical protein
VESKLAGQRDRLLCSSAGGKGAGDGGGLNHASVYTSMVNLTQLLIADCRPVSSSTMLGNFGLSGKYRPLQHQTTNLKHQNLQSEAFLPLSVGSVTFSFASDMSWASMIRRWCLFGEGIKAFREVMIHAANIASLCWYLVNLDWVVDFPITLKVDMISWTAMAKSSTQKEVSEISPIFPTA